MTDVAYTWRDSELRAFPLRAEAVITAAVKSAGSDDFGNDSEGGPQAPQRHPYVERWEADGEFVHSAYTLRADDDDWVRPARWFATSWTTARDRLVANVVGHPRDGVSAPVLERAFEYWRNVDKEIGDRIAQAVQGA